MTIEGAKFMALVHVVIAAIGFNYFQGMESRPLPWSTIVFGVLCAWPPILAAWGGARLTAGPKSAAVLFAGVAIAVVVALLVCVSVITQPSEPLAALFLPLTTIGQIFGLAVWMLFVWSVARTERFGQTP